MSDDQGKTEETTGTSESGEALSAPDLSGQLEAQRQINKKLEARQKSDLRKMEALEKRLAELSEGSAPRDEVASEIEKARKEAAAEAVSAANLRIVRAEVKAAATGKFADPADAVLFLDLSGFSVDDDGEVDSAAIMAALDDLLEKKPHLGAKGAARWSGSGDGGPRGQASANVLPGLNRLAHAYATSEKTARP